MPELLKSTVVRAVSHNVMVAVIAAAILAGSSFVWELLRKDGSLVEALGGVSEPSFTAKFAAHEADHPDSMTGERPTGQPDPVSAFFKDAVVAFDRRDGCPRGWAPFADADRRTIVGASQSGMEGYRYNDIGGEESILLAESHVPGHSHGFLDVYYSESDNQKPSGATAQIVPDARGHAGGSDNNNVGWAYDSETYRVGPDPGEQLSFTNMQPYVALHYCKPE